MSWLNDLISGVKWLQWKAIPRPDGTTIMWRFIIFECVLFAIWIHKFVHNDQAWPHSHPRTITSVLLWGNYRQETFQWSADSDKVLSEAQRFYAGEINVVLPDTVHRIRGLKGPCWTLCFCGKVMQNWCFYAPDTFERITPSKYFMSNGYPNWQE